MRSRGTRSAVRASDPSMRAALALLLVAACTPRPGGPTVRTPVTQPAGAPASAPATAEPDPAAPGKVYTFEPLRIDILGGDQVRTYDARALLEEGNEALMDGRYDEALAAFDHLLADFPDSKMVPAALYNAGLALEGKQDYTGACDRYRKILALVPATSADSLDASFRLGSALAEIGQFGESQAVFEKALERDDLSPTNRIEALARLGYALLSQQDYAGAEEVLRQALAYHRDLGAEGEHLDNTYFVAMCQFYLAEIPHRQFRALPLRYPQAQMERDLEQKSQLFLLARDRYIKVVSYRSPYWATDAVYQIGLMYQEFWDDWMAVPVPADLDPEAAKLYVEEVNKHPELRRLLERALLYHQRNVAMAKGGNVTTVWSAASVAAAEEVRKLIARLDQGQLVTPGSGNARTQAFDPSSVGGSAVSADYIPARVDL
jgi:tetratricopeptide (TPR) repeat protein